MYKYYLATLVRIPLKDRSFAHTTSFTTTTTELINRMLSNPLVCTDFNLFKTMCIEMGLDYTADSELMGIHTAYLSKMQDYVTEVKKLSPAQYEQQLQSLA
ncbi:MAG: hypothetical protein ACTSYI_03340, partial [Promethearchaeota archaeon]